MTDDCPNCGAPFSDRITVETGDRYENAFGPPPASLFNTYARICPDPDAAKRAARDPNVGIDVFLHRHGDLQPGSGLST
ncbi:hypothetical protein SAMN04487947_3252 [Halogeometricum rufum]|uniref:Uncharacterized protein n=1 Tax=Halogeometricum rufum TaxID=553469 RepID=A0A1I6IH84_9EURY|nr:hypothetical protein [Halogeometricum rufum]SFR66048.1 hypothetical protein SAMN04487947_3252 [Halogeometricum rufum]